MMHASKITLTSTATIIRKNESSLFECSSKGGGGYNDSGLPSTRKQGQLTCKLLLSLYKQLKHQNSV